MQLSFIFASRSLLLSLFFCVCFTQNCQFQRRDVFNVQNQTSTAVNTFNITHNFGNNFAYNIILSSTNQISAEVLLSLNLPKFLSSDYLSYIFNDRTPGAVSLNLQSNFIDTSSTTSRTSTSFGLRLNLGSFLFFSSLSFFFIFTSLRTYPHKIVILIAFLITLSFVLAQPNCVSLIINLTVPANVKTVCVNNKCQNTSFPTPITYSVCPIVAVNATSSNSKLVFDPLTEAEFQLVLSYLLGRPELNLTSYASATLANNYLVSIEHELPPKTAVLNYLDNGGSFPGRLAKAVAYYGGGSPFPFVREIIVGPLDRPLVINYTISTLYGDGQGRIPFLTRPIDDIEYGYLDTALINEFAKMKNLSKQSFGTYYGETGCSPCLTDTDLAPKGYTQTQRQSWYAFFFDVTGLYSHPIGLELLINHSSTNPNDWTCIGVTYNGQFFSNTESLVAAYNSNSLNKTVKSAPVVGSYERQRTAFEAFGPQRNGENLAPPRHYQPQGPRFIIQGNRIDWVGWSVSFQTRPTSGPQLYDIRFKGERIVYEFGVQDSAAYYTGFSPAFQAMTAYQDDAWGMGTSAYELRGGVDCPPTAAFLNFTFWKNGQLKTLRNSMCVFEQDLAMPVRRHYDQGDPYNFYGGVPSYVLVIRTANAVYNYDYLYDQIFYLNGVFESKVATTGYLQAGPYFSLDVNLGYGNKVGNYAMGSLHDHLINYKIDLDIQGTQNTFERIDIVRDVQNFTWNPYLQPWAQKKYVKNLIQTENDAKMVYNFDIPRMWTFQNPNSTNIYGTPKSYRIQTNGVNKNLVGNDPISNAIKWSKYQLACTQRKESEPRSQISYNQAIPFVPVLDFDSFFNNESLVMQDIVCWATVGLPHIPHSEDIPATATPGNSVSIFLKPYNYFDNCPASDIRNSQVITPDPITGAPIVNTNGINYNPKCVPSENVPDFDGRVFVLN